jgi:hypothetical protein
MAQIRVLGILLALGTLFVLFYHLVPPTDLIAKVLIASGWIGLVASVFSERRKRLHQEEARLAAHMELWMAEAAKKREESASKQE